LDRVAEVAVFLKDMADFTAVNEVGAVYSPDNCPARSCIQEGQLPLEALIEIEAIAVR